MKKNKAILNMSILFFSFALVLFFRTETVKMTYKNSQDFSRFKKKEASYQLAATRFKKKSESQRAFGLLEEKVLALESVKSRQVVMLGKNGVAF